VINPFPWSVGNAFLHGDGIHLSFVRVSTLSQLQTFNLTKNPKGKISAPLGALIFSGL
jgi:hypothetical protein